MFDIGYGGDPEWTFSLSRNSPNEEYAWRFDHINKTRRVWRTRRVNGKSKYDQAVGCEIPNNCWGPAIWYLGYSAIEFANYLINSKQEDVDLLVLAVKISR